MFLHVGKLTAAGAAMVLSLVTASLAAQSPTPVAPTAARAADPKDVATLDAIVAALYASISGPKGAPRDFDRMRTLFAPNARLIPTGVDQGGPPRLRSWTVEEYVANAGPGLMANGFFEREIGHRLAFSADHNRLPPPNRR